MLSINKIYFYIFLIVLIIQIPCIEAVKFLDELCVVILLLLATLDMVVNHNFKRYKYLFWLFGIFSFYLIYTLAFRNFNIPQAVLSDYIIQMKPFIPFLVTYALCPSLTEEQKKVIKIGCICITSFLFIVFITGLTKYTVGYVTYIGVIAFLCFILYLYCCVDKKGQITRKELFIALGMLSVGLMSTRAKYFGEFVFAIYFLFWYKPGLFRKIKLSQIILFVIAIIAMFAVSWYKIEYYFISGNVEDFDVDIMEAFARPVLYGTMGLILLDFPIFGSGLASFATIASTPLFNYSSLYYEYSINNVWGLSEDMPLFICDAFYPELAQFGLIGIILFFLFWKWIYFKLRIILHKENKVLFYLGLLIIIFFAIESVGGTMFVQGNSVLAMMTLGLIVSKYKHITNKEAKEIFKTGYNNNNTKLIKLK